MDYSEYLDNIEAAIPFLISSGIESKLENAYKHFSSGDLDMDFSITREYHFDYRVGVFMVTIYMKLGKNKYEYEMVIPVAPDKTYKGINTFEWYISTFVDTVIIRIGHILSALVIAICTGTKVELRNTLRSVEK